MVTNIINTKLKYTNWNTNSNKQYELVISENIQKKEYIIEAFYGRVGNSPTHHEVLKTNDFKKAFAKYNSQLKAKIKKGYTQTNLKYNSQYYIDKLNELKQRNAISNEHYQKLTKLALTEDWANLQLINNYLNK